MCSKVPERHQKDVNCQRSVLIYFISLYCQMKTQVPRGTTMKIRHFCLFCAIPAISDLICMLLFAFISTSSNFNDLFVLNLGTNWN